MLANHLLLMAGLLFGGPQEGAFDATIRMAESLEPGQSAEIEFSLKLGEGWSAGGKDPRPLIQVKAPASVELEGRRLTELRDLARNGFLQAPFERMPKSDSDRIGFKLKQAPAAGRTDRVQRAGLPDE